MWPCEEWGKPTFFLFGQAGWSPARLQCIGWRPLKLLVYIKGLHRESLAVYDATLHRTGSGFHFKVELDNLSHPLGAVSLDDCAQMSQWLVSELDRLITDPALVQEWEIPEELGVENYTLEVSSAGAERKLRLPGDLDRFKGAPVKIGIRNDSGGVTRHIAVYTGNGGKSESDLTYQFQLYRPRHGRGKQGRKKKEPGNAGRIGSSDRKDGILSVPAADLVEARLYLDF